MKFKILFPFFVLFATLLSANVTQVVKADFMLCVLPFKNNTNLGANEINEMSDLFASSLNSKQGFSIVHHNSFYHTASSNGYTVENMNIEQICIVGAMLDLDFVLINSVSHDSREYSFEVRIADVKSTNVIGSVRPKYPRTMSTTEIMSKLADDTTDKIKTYVEQEELADRIQRELEEAEQLIQAIETRRRLERLQAIVSKYGKAYQVGDTGPAGGIIVYAKDNVDEWTFLEAAPKSAEFNAHMGNISSINNFTTSMGDGYTNTFLMYAVLVRNGERNTATQRILELEFGGYKDWYIPHQYEYGIIPKGGEGLTPSLYWTSDGYYTCACENLWGVHGSDSTSCANYSHPAINSERRIYYSTALAIRPMRRF